MLPLAVSARKRQCDRDIATGLHGEVDEFEQHIIAESQSLTM